MKLTRELGSVGSRRSGGSAYCFFFWFWGVHACIKAGLAGLGEEAVGGRLRQADAAGRGLPRM